MPKRRISALQKAELKRQKQIQRQRERDKEKAKKRATTNERKRLKKHYTNKKREAIVASQESVRSAIEEAREESIRVRNIIRQQECCLR